MANAELPTSLPAEGEVRLTLSGSSTPIQVATLEVDVPIVFTPGKAGEMPSVLVDQDGLRANLADALEAVAAELRAGA